MNLAEVAARAVNYAGSLLLFGASLFAIYAPGQARGDAHDGRAQSPQALRRDVWRLQLGCAVTTIAATLLWLAIHSADVASLPLREAVASGVAAEILAATLFGRAMTWHLAFAAAFIAMLVLGRIVGEGRWRAYLDAVEAALAASVLATLAWTGHAAATRGFDRYVHLGCDVVHLLAAGAWLGALPLLAVVLMRAAQRQLPALDRTALVTTRRFSAVGVGCVGALLVTGTVNACYLVATPSALFETRYGQLLLAKLALFAVMLAFAVRNRFALTPRIEETVRGKSMGAGIAMRGVARNAWIEAALGLAIVVIVGALGISVPGAHMHMHMH